AINERAPAILPVTITCGGIARVSKRAHKHDKEPTKSPRASASHLCPSAGPQVKRWPIFLRKVQESYARRNNHELPAVLPTDYRLLGGDDGRDVAVPLPLLSGRHCRTQCAHVIASGFGPPSPDAPHCSEGLCRASVAYTRRAWLLPAQRHG